MNIYLDIDGVLLANDLHAASYVHEFLELVTTNHQAYWLTTHCQGDSKTAYSYLSRFLEPKTLKLIKDIKPTSWNVLKTDALDYSKPFLWFDDDLFIEEKRILSKRGVLDNHIVVDLAKDENQLQKFVNSFPYL